mgnify:CR=1 FL=1
MNHKKAIKVGYGALPDHVSITEQEFTRALAAFLRAVEPSQHMVDAGWEAIYDTIFNEVEGVATSAGWRAMRDKLADELEGKA